MTKNTKQVLSLTCVLVVLIVGLFLLRDVELKHGRTIECGADGAHQTIDLRDFTTTYWAYSIELETAIKDQAKFSAKLAPQKLQDLSDALQTAQQFRAYVVAGYNSCAITKSQYAELGTRFQALDGLAREINALLSKASLTQDERTKLGDLIQEFRKTVDDLNSK